MIMIRYVKHMALWGASLLRNNRKGKILFYHDVHIDTRYERTSTPLELFKMHMDVVRNKGFCICDGLPLGMNEIMVCFDDGLRGIWDCKDYFIESGIAPTVFLIWDKIGTQGYLSKDEILELKAKGFVFQSHGITHRSLTDIASDDAVYGELADSKLKLEAMLNTEVTGFCFPRGMMTKKIYNLALRAGYKELYSSVPGSADDMLADRLYRRNLCQSFTATEIVWVLKGAVELFAHRYINRQIPGGL